jgi:hypothetical protein
MHFDVGEDEKPSGLRIAGRKVSRRAYMFVDVGKNYGRF